jgi:hypothetical protein
MELSSVGRESLPRNGAILHAEAIMSSITISIPDESMAELREKAARLRTSPEELLRASVEELLARPDAEFEHALEYVLRKNQELYRRLA